MDNKNFTITKIINRKPASIRNIKSEMEDGSLLMSYTQNIISQIVETREQKEFEFVCSQIQQFIEKENIDACFVMNKNELIDCLKGHKILQKALELACERVKYFEEMQDREMGHFEFFGYDNEYDLQAIIEQYKEQAKEIMKSE